MQNKKEILTGRDYLICIDGSEKDIKEAMKPAFDFCIKQFQAGRWNARKKLGKIEVSCHINAERALRKKTA